MYTAVSELCSAGLDQCSCLLPGLLLVTPFGDMRFVNCSCSLYCCL